MAKPATKSAAAKSAPAPAPAAELDPTLQALVDRAAEIKNVLEALGKPGNEDPYLRMLGAWEQVSLLLSLVKDCEMDMRLKLFAGAFPNPKEGTNVHKMPDGRELVGQHKVTRKIDEAALAPVLAAMRAAGVANTDKLVRYKPELAKSEWNSLSDENKIRFSPAVIATPGSPTFEIRIPKRARR
jgi:hypothetical protein